MVPDAGVMGPEAGRAEPAAAEEVSLRAAAPHPSLSPGAPLPLRAPLLGRPFFQAWPFWSTLSQQPGPGVSTR